MPSTSSLLHGVQTMPWFLLWETSHNMLIWQVHINFASILSNMNQIVPLYHTILSKKNGCLSFIHLRQMICTKRDYYIFHHAPQLLFLLYKDQMMHDIITLTKLNEYFAFSPCTVREKEQEGTKSLVTFCVIKKTWITKIDLGLFGLWHYFMLRIGKRSQSRTRFGTAASTNL